MIKRVIVIIFISVFSAIVRAEVKTGIEVLKSVDFEPLRGQRVGLITNPTGVDSEMRSTIDLLNEAEGVELVALFAPEHGVRGDVVAGAGVSTFMDEKTGVKVYSLYGKTHKPTSAMLKGIDVLVYDIQDIGCRSYTFISTMGKAMEACAEQGVKFMVLDRPNPLGGEKVEGCLVDSDCKSFVSQYPIPYVYGLTVGELARYLNEEGMLQGGVKAELEVVAMEGWKRQMTWESTGLKWVLTSPHIPQSQTAYFYPSSGILGELDYMSIGVGYTLPFEVFCAAWVDSQQLADELNSKSIEGWIFRPIHIRPRYGFGSGKTLEGVQAYISDYDAATLTLLQFYVMEAVAELYPLHKPFATSLPARLNSFDNVCGSKEIRKLFVSSGYKVASIEEKWMSLSNEFKIKSEKYYLYD